MTVIMVMYGNKLIMMSMMIIMITATILMMIVVMMTMKLNFVLILNHKQ